MPNNPNRLRLSDEPTKSTIIRLRGEGYSWDWIGKLYAISGPTARNRAIQLGVPLKKPASALVRFVAPDELPKDKPIIDGDYCRRDGREGQVKDDLARLLRRAGYTVKTEFRMGEGRVDILAQKNERMFLVEVKLGIVTNCAKAVGQVLFYAETLSSARPVVAVPLEIAQNPRFASLCNRLGVEIWPLERGLPPCVVAE